MNDVSYITAGEPARLYELYRQGIELIKAIQRIEHPVLTVIIKILTNTGTAYFYIPVILFILWCIDEKKGLRLGLLIFLSAWVNGICKTLLKQPRPYQLDPSVGRSFERSYGIPSGHAQISLTFWVPFASWIGDLLQCRRKGKIAAWGSAILFSLLIGFTRLYLGLHFPTDLLAGWLLGSIILAGYFCLTGPLTKLFTAGGTRLQLISVAVIAWGMNALGGDRSVAGLFLGFGLGYGLMLKYFPFSAHAPVKGRKPGLLLLGTRYALGMTGSALIYWGLNLLLPSEASLFYELGHFIRYGSLGLWATAGAPLLFLRLRIAATALK